MSFSRRHPNDAALLLLLENDLQGRARSRVERHLERCAACRARRSELEEACALVANARPFQADAPASPARERLAALLAEKAHTTGSGRLQHLRSRFAVMPVLLRFAVIVALISAAVLWRQLDLPLQDRMAAYEDTGPEPNHVLTPGSVNPVELSRLCELNDANLDPQVSPEKQRAVFHAYGLSPRAARAYQVDYLINPQLGGNDDLANLWPEPYHATVWNAQAKDALEARLHGMVCSGKLELSSARADLAHDWVAAYKKYFGVQRPVRTIAELDRRP